MPQQIRQRTEKVVTFNKNSKVPVSLDRGMVYRELYLTLTMKLKDNGINAFTLSDIQPGDEWAIVRGIEFLLNSNDSIRYISGEQLQMFNLMWYNNARRLSSLINPGAVGSTYTIKSNLILPFWMPKSVKPIDTALDARLLSDIKVRVDWGDVSDIIATTGAAIDTNPELNVATLESFGMDGPFNTMRIFSQDYSNVSTQDKYQVELPVGNIYRSFLINTKDSNGYDLADAITNFRLRSGSVIFADVDADVVRDSFLQRNGIRNGFDDTNNKVLPYFASPHTDLDGWIYFDLVSDGYMTEAIDTLGFSSLTMELKVAKDITKLSILPLEVIPLRKSG